MSIIRPLLTDPAWRAIFVDTIRDDVNVKHVNVEFGADRDGNRVFMLDNELIKQVGKKYFRVEYPTTESSPAASTSAEPVVSEPPAPPQNSTGPRGAAEGG